MKTKFYYLAFLLLIQLAVKAQMKIGTTPTTINSASLLELESTNQGFVLPRVSISDVSTSSPLLAVLLTGTMVYNTNSGTTGGSGVGIYYWDGSKWNFMANTSITANYWSLTGNTGTNASSNFIGTLDATDFVTRTANTERMRILGAASGSSKAGWIGMGVTIPRSSLDVTGHYTNKNVLTIENSSTSGFSSVDMMDSAGNLKGTFGYANSGTGGLFAGKNYFNIYGNDFIFTTNSTNYDFFIKGSNGYVGINTNTPSERLHVVGNFYLTGAFMPNGLPGTSGYVLTSAGAATAPTWSNLNSLAWNLTGNSGTSYANNFLGTTDNISMRFRTNNIQRMIIDSLGKVGIGLNNPSYALSVLSASNPLYLSGVQATASFSADSVLTINSGVVKKTPYSSLTNNFWSLTGNSGTSYATNFLGTTDNVSLRFRTNNIERMVIDSLGSVAIGSNNFDALSREKLLVDYGTTTSNDVAGFKGNINDFLQIGIQNLSNGINASSDYVATSDDGTDSTYYIDMGINSSTYAPSSENFGGPHDGYLYTYSRNLLIGTEAAGSDIIFLLGGNRIKNSSVLRLAGPTGNVVVGAGENSSAPIGNIIRGPNAQSTAINTAGGNLTLSGGSATGTATGGSVNITGGSTSSATTGPVNINISSAGATNLNTGTATGTVTIGGTANNINLPKLSATSVVLTDASKNLTSTTPSSNTYLYYNGTNFTWSAAATLGSFSATLPLTYNNTTGVFAINQSTSSTDGYLSSTDWNTFNNKVGSITLNTPSSVFSNPITFAVSSGAATGTLSLNTQAAGTIFAGPVNLASGTLPAVPTFRALVASDIPSLGGIYIQNQTTLQASSNFSISGNGTIGTNLTVTGKSTLNGVTNTGTLTSSGGDVNININSNSSTNINTGTSTSNVTIGNANNNILLPKFNTAGGMIYTAASTGQIASTGSNMIWDNINSRLGIGTASPSNKLSVLAASDPLYLSGVQATAAFTTDSVLTIFNGVVKKAPYSSLPVPANAWLLTGNSISAGNFLGTTNAQALVFKANNIQMGYFDGNVSSLALGVGAVNSSSDHNVAIGYNASTNNQYALALGYSAAASGVRSIAIGNGASATTASGAESIAMGYNANANNAQTVAIGYQAQATGQYGVALGYNPTASGLQSVAIGYQAQATQQYSNAIGYQAQATGLQSTAIGYHAQTAQTNTILLGDVSTPNLYVGIGTATPSAKLDILASAGNNPLEITGLPAGTVGTDNILTINSSGVVGSVTASNFSGNYWTLSGNAAASGSFLGTTNTTPLLFKYNSISAGTIDANNNTAFGASYTIAGSTNTAIGYSSNASNSATAVGASSIANAVNNTALGNNATANLSSQETALGSSATANAQYNTAVGYSAQAVSNSQATAIGTSSLANAFQSTSLGYGAQAISNAQTTALGVSALSNAQYNTAVGYSAQAISNSQATAIGTSSKANAQYNTAVGYNAQAITSSQATAIGTNSSASGSNSTVIGYGATTSQTNAIVLGTSSNNVGIGTSTPNTSTKLDVAGSFKLGTAGSVLGSVIKSSFTISPTVNLGTTTTYTATVTGAATGASVIVNPRSTLASGVVIAYSYVSGANTITIALTSGSTTGALGSLTFDVTVIQ